MPFQMDFPGVVARAIGPQAAAEPTEQELYCVAANGFSGKTGTHTAAMTLDNAGCPAVCTDRSPEWGG